MENDLFWWHMMNIGVWLTDSGKNLKLNYKKIEIGFKNRF